MNSNDQNSNDRNGNSTPLVLNFENLNFGFVSNFDIRISDLSSSSPAYIIYTSGSTGRPRGVPVRHHSLVNLCMWHNRYYGVTEADNAAQFAGFGFDAAVWETFPYLLKGASLHILSPEIKLDPHRLNRYFERHHITVSFLPTQWCEQFMAMEEENRSLRVLLTGGDKLRRFRERRYKLYNNYGPTENTVVTSSCLVEADAANIPIGKPVDNSMIVIMNKEHSRLQPIGVAGELCITGAGVAMGYLNNPELTAERFSRGAAPSLSTPPSSPLYRTGDLARWLADGNIEFLGRIDRQVKVRGYRIELGEIEAALLGHENVKEAVVTDFEDNRGNKALCAYITANGAGIEGLKEYLQKRLPVYMVPSYFVTLEKIPLTANGKVDKKALPPPETEQTAVREYSAPRSEMEKRIAGVWEEILGIETVGRDHNFFELGGTSLDILTVSEKLKTALGKEVKVVNLFRYPNLAALAAHLESGDEGVGEALTQRKEDIYKAIDSSKDRMKQRRKKMRTGGKFGR